MLSNISCLLFKKLPLSYYLFISIFVLLVFNFKTEISESMFLYTNIYIHPTNLVLVTNLILLLYIPLVYMTLLVVEHMCMKDYNNDGKPDLMFMDPFEYWKLTHKK